MSTSVIGTAVTRVDGRLKVTGAAPYALDHAVENMAYGVGVPSTIGNGRITRIDASAAEKMPGVVAVLYHGNADPLYSPASGLEPDSHAGEARPPFADDKVYYYGQYVAVVVADTFEQAMDAAAHVKVEYQTDKPVVALADAPAPTGAPVHNYSRGDAGQAFESAPVKIDVTYTTPVETHNPMEMHGTTAVWNGDKLTLYASTQALGGHHSSVAEMLGAPLENVQVIAPFCGGGFGSKLDPWPQAPLTAMAARRVKRPVKMYTHRHMMFTTVGHRPVTQQRIRLGATPDGKLLSMQQDAMNHTSMVGNYVEGCTEPTGMLYSCANVSAIQHIVPLNVGTPTAMRGPGTTPGLFAIESAMDELAIKLNMDPLELRMRNYAQTDESSNKPFSSKHLREAYQTGADKFGWSKRTPKVGSMRRGTEILGWGMATATWGAYAGGAEVRVRLMTDGTARVSCGSQDPGTGTYTIFAQIVSDKTGIPVDKIEVVLGDSNLPPGPTSGGSAATASLVTGTAKAAQSAIDILIKAAVRTDNSPFHGADAGTLQMSNGRLHVKGQTPESGVPFQQILALRHIAAVEATERAAADSDRKTYSFHSFGAHFCEVTWDPGIARLRVTRWVSVIDAGRIINLKAGRNQILGAMVMGVGMGMLEETVYDHRNGKPVNNNLADYLVSTNADIPETECIFLDYPDMHLNEYGARGIGEIGLTGVASAITMATYHATGVRVRNLPIRIEDLLT